MSEEPKFLLLCPICKKPVKECGKDDIQSWYSCESGHKTAHPIKQPNEALKLLWQVGEFNANLAKPSVEEQKTKPKNRNKCGQCVAFHTPFCSWDRNGLTRSRDDACSDFYPKMRKRAKAPDYEEFLTEVENLE